MALLPWDMVPATQIMDAQAGPLVLKLFSMNAGAIMTGAVRHTLSANMGVFKEFSHAIMHRGFEYLTY